MTRPVDTILGISPSTFKMGIALYSYGTLVDWKLRNYTGKLSNSKIDYILETLEKIVVKHNVTHIAIKQIFMSLTTPDMKKLVTGIKSISKRKKIPFYEYALEEMERYCSDDRKRSKKSLINCLIEKYPELQKEYIRAIKWNNQPYQKVFEAVGAIELCLLDLRNI